MKKDDLALVRVASDGWTLWDGQTWQTVSAYPALTRAAWLWLDHADWPTAVWRFDGQPAHARAYVERRVRQEGLLTEAAHLVLHRVQAVRGAGFEVWFTAIPLSIWQPLQAWCRRAPVHLLPVHTAGLMAACLTREGACVWRSGLRWMVAARSTSGWQWAEAQAFEHRPEVMVQALRLALSDAQIDPRNGTAALHLTTLWSADDWDIGHLWAEAVGERDAMPQTVHSPKVSPPGGEQGQLGVITVLQRWGERAQIGGGLARAAWWAERWTPALIALMAMTAVGTWSVGAWAHQQAQAVQAEVAHVRTAAQQRERERIGAARWRPAPDWRDAAQRAQRLSDALALDPVGFLRLLQHETDASLLIQRVRLQTAGEKLQGFQVEGRAPLGRPQAVLTWLERMRTAGWQATPVTATVAEPGAFAWLFAPDVAPNGEARP